MTEHDDGLYLTQMLEAAERAHLKVEGISVAEFLGDENLRLAVTHLLQTIGEAARHVSVSGRDLRPEVPWDDIVGMRHRIVHGYAEVDDEMIYRTSVEDLPPLIDSLRRFL